MVHFSEYSGRVEEICLPEDGPTDLEANVSIADAEWAKEEAMRADSQPGLVLWADENGGTGSSAPPQSDPKINSSPGRTSDIQWPQ